MSVRRLAEASVQPASFAFRGENADWAKATIAKYPEGRQQSAVIPLLMRAQEQEGWVSKAAIEHVAAMLDMPQIRVLEVATFYTQYQLKPVGTKAHVQVCGTTPCMLRGSEALMDVCRSKIHHEQFHTNASGTLSWEEVECLGACVNAPMVMVFKDTYEDLTPERLAEIIDAFERGQPMAPGPQIDRVYSAPVGGLTSLTDEKAVLKSTRDREARDAARAAKASAAGDAATVVPSNAARPKTDAIETNPAVKSPSPVKTSPNGEKTASVKAPRHDKAAADRAAPEVEGTAEPRSHAKPRKTVRDEKAPELLHGEALGPDGKRTPEQAPAPVGVMSAGTDRAGKGSKPPQPSLESKDRPAGIARPDRPDDLQLISGVGPKNEAILHSLGIFTFAQVASWKRAEREWVDGYLRFGGRIEREDWVRQAAALAKGGEAEYIRVFGKKPR
jgi:NADH-quinone oxidoreductase subunit E